MTNNIPNTDPNMLVVIGEAHPLQMVVQGVADVVGHMLSEGLAEVVLEVGEEAAQRGYYGSISAGDQG